MGLLLALMLLIPTTAQENSDEFEVSGTIHHKYFLTKDQRATILNDYRDYNDYAVMELGVELDFQVPLPFELEPLSVFAHPYFLISQEQGLSHIGLEGEIEYPICEDWQIGYRHYSWHNSDDDTPNNRGRTQDAFFTVWNFAETQIDESAKLDFYLRPQIYAYNTDPLDIKDIYNRHLDPPARYALMAGAELHCGKWQVEIWPYVKTDDETEVWLYGIKNLLVYNIFENLALEAEFHEILSEEKNLSILTFGFLIRFH